MPLRAFRGRRSRSAPQCEISTSFRLGSAGRSSTSSGVPMILRAHRLESFSSPSSRVRLLWRSSSFLTLGSLGSERRSVSLAAFKTVIFSLVTSAEIPARPLRSPLLCRVMSAVVEVSVFHALALASGAMLLIVVRSSLMMRSAGLPARASMFRRPALEMSQ